MILTPTDIELSWKDVEANFLDVPSMAEQTWAAAGILMPDDAAEDLKLTMIESLLTRTAAALALPVSQIYPMRNRIRWLTFTDTPALRVPLYASLDGGTAHLVPCNWPSCRG